MVDKILIGSGLALMLYKGWHDSLPLARRLKVGDQATMGAAEVLRAVGVPHAAGIPLDSFAIVEILALKPQTFLGKVLSVVSGDGKQVTLPAGPMYASVEFDRNLVRSVMREGTDGWTRPVT